MVDSAINFCRFLSRSRMVSFMVFARLSTPQGKVSISQRLLQRGNVQLLSIREALLLNLADLQRPLQINQRPLSLGRIKIQINEGEARIERLYPFCKSSVHKPSCCRHRVKVREVGLGPHRHEAGERIRDVYIRIANEVERILVFYGRDGESLTIDDQGKNRNDRYTGQGQKPGSIARPDPRGPRQWPVGFRRLFREPVAPLLSSHPPNLDFLERRLLLGSLIILERSLGIKGVYSRANSPIPF